MRYTQTNISMHRQRKGQTTNTDHNIKYQGYNKNEIITKTSLVQINKQQSKNQLAPNLLYYKNLATKDWESTQTITYKHHHHHSQNTGLYHNLVFQEDHK